MFGKSLNGCPGSEGVNGARVGSRGSESLQNMHKEQGADGSFEKMGSIRENP